MPTSDVEVQTRLFARLWQYGEAAKVEVAANRTVDEVIYQRCGFITQPLRSLILRQNPGLNFQAQPQARVVALPPCPYWRFEKGKIDLSRTRNLSRTLLLRIGFNGDKTMKDVADRNPTLVSPTGQILKNYGELVLPYESRSFTFVLRNRVGTPAYVARTLAKEFPALIKAHFVVNYVDEGAGAVFRVDSAIPVSAPATFGCAGRPSDWPFNFDRVAAALETNAKIRIMDRRKATILVADTGLREADKESFPLRRDPYEDGPNAQRGRDNNGNEYIDDIFGANMNLDPGFPAAVEEFPDANHGTQVASMIIAGFGNPRLRLLLESRLELSIVNVVSAEPAGTEKDGQPRYFIRIPPSGVERVFGYAEGMHPVRPAVVNMSLTSSTPYPALIQILKNAQYLTVIAAGNDGERIDLSNKERYPANYRRNFKQQIITVAAHDGDGKIAKFSNRGPKVVDLVAPGCALDTVGFGGERLSSSGTSLAAPLVSLTAALLYSEGFTDPREIRNRILATTDFDASLREAVYTSGRLNIEKALRVYQDIVVPRKSDGTADAPKFGKIAAIDSLKLNICNDQIDLRNILKIIPNFDTGNNPMLVLRKIVDYGGEHLACAQTQDVTIEFLEDGKPPSRHYKLSELHELIPALQ